MKKEVMNVEKNREVDVKPKNLLIAGIVMGGGVLFWIGMYIGTMI